MQDMVILLVSLYSGNLSRFTILSIGPYKDNEDDKPKTLCKNLVE